MQDSEENRLKAEDMRFLFFFKPQQQISQCCCGCTLRLGTQILCILYLLGSLGTSISAITVLVGYKVDSIYYVSLIASVLQIIGPGMILMSTFNNNFKIAYIGNMIYTIFVFIGLIITIITPFTLTYFQYEIAGYIFYYLFYLPAYVLVIYYALVIYFFVKNIGLGNLAAVDGQQTLIVASEYQSVGIQNNTNQTGYVPNVATMTVSTQAYSQPQSSYPAYDPNQNNNTYGAGQGGQGYQSQGGYQPPNTGNQQGGYQR